MRWYLEVAFPSTYDTGLLAWLLGIESADQLDMHASRGAIFESFVVSEIAKARFTAERPWGLYFWRDQSGHEVDLVEESPAGPRALEAKSGATLNGDFFKGLLYFQELAGKKFATATLVYGGSDRATHHGCHVLPWHAASTW
ncbi:MAG TPA: DUF4143 domain-containing protein [Polyangia bacterium]|nr:DUF4143 domain-containing protein [Polyangia bacterium]